MFKKKTTLRLCYVFAVFCQTSGVAFGVVLDDFQTLGGWVVTHSPDTHVTLVNDAGRRGRGMRLDFAFHGSGGQFLVRKRFARALPDDYAFTFYIRAKAPKSDFFLKLFDATERNVWWWRQYDLSFPRHWRRYRVKKSMLEYAWGPSPGTVPTQVGVIEFTIASPTGGKGSIWLDELHVEKRPPAMGPNPVPQVTASSSMKGHTPANVLDQRPETIWRSDRGHRQWLQLDFLRSREYGGLTIAWDPADYATAYRVQTSQDGRQWRSVYTVRGGKGRGDDIYLPDGESRYVRLELRRSSRGRGYAIRELAVEPCAFSATPNHFFAALARAAPRGIYPRYFLGEQNYFAVVGADAGHPKEGLLGMDGALEVDRGAFSIEPFLYVDGRLVTWNEGQPEQRLTQNHLPIPSVTWRYGALTLTTTAFADSEALYARYQVANTSGHRLFPRLFLALRPFQVNPPWQSLNMQGGVARLTSLRRRGREILIDAERSIIALSPPQRFGAATFAQGPITDWLEEGQVPAQTRVDDTLGFASAALMYALDLAPGSAREIYLAIPHGRSKALLHALAGARSDADAVGRSRLQATITAWNMRLARVAFSAPPEAERFIDIVKSTLAWIFVNRDGPAIQPGSRTYARSWIRDGALTSSALLGFGYADVVRPYLEWYARHQFADGKIPCCVDWRGADSVPENDSHGEFLYAIAEYYRHTRDIRFVHELWPHIVKAVAYIEAQRALRLTEEYREGEKQIFWGLMPESISHEGYAARPVHAYWDDFWTLRGLKDAAWLAGEVGDTAHVEHYARLRDDFCRDLHASLAQVIARRGLDYIPASAELGDFDPNAVALFITVAGELPRLPKTALYRTFDEWWAYFCKRRAGELNWDAYTPYEVRLVEALVHLGQRERAWEVLHDLVAHQFPAAWHQWTEVVWRDFRTPKFIGDMPHTWIGAEYLRAFRSLYAYERESDQALVLAAGLPQDWLEREGGVAVEHLSTWYGMLGYRLRRQSPGELRLSLFGSLRLPPGKIVVRAPAHAPLKEVIVNDRPVMSFNAEEAVIAEFPSEVVLRY